MTDDLKFKQCMLQFGKRDPRKQTCWIPERGAHLGYKLELLEDGNFWEVIEVYPQIMTREEITLKQQRNRQGLTSINRPIRKARS